MAAEDLRSVQWAKLSALLQRLIKSDSGYAGILSDLGGLTAIDSIEAFSEKVPFTTKEQIITDRELHPPYGSYLTEPITSYTRFCQSSGTTRGPMAWLDTEESWGAMLRNWTRVFDEAAVSPDETVFFAFSFGPFLGFWTAFEAAVARGNLSLPGGGLSSEARLQMMARYGVKILCCTPTYALRLGELYQQKRAAEGAAFSIDLSKIIVAGEPGGGLPEVRSAISEAWGGADVFDHHGMTEVGPVSFESQAHRGSLCVIDESFITEVIDPETGREVNDGEQGELVLTPLDRAASPLLRYRTGDLVEKGAYDIASGACAGDRGTLLRGGILGRLDEMIIVRGVNIYPAAIERIVRRFPEVAEFQVQESRRASMSELLVRIEVVEGVAGAQGIARAIEGEFTNAFAMRIPVEVVEAESLPRFEFKSRRWVVEGS